mmetsp:Transcript_47814/g.112432  ORF Transcript_47814/g.112432 Transcript_47814/m.112432 type:complete len:145 (-) Transcript_47814:28-462(-)
MFRVAAELLESMPRAELARVNIVLTTLVRVNQPYYYSLAYKYLAIQHWEAGEYGKGVGMARNAIRTMQFVSTIPEDPSMTSLKVKMTQELTTIQLLLQEYERDNAKIYHERVHDAPEENMLPEAKVLVAPMVFEPPPPAFVVKF